MSIREADHQLPGYHICPEGMKMDPKKVDVLQDWQPTRWMKDVQWLLGFAIARSFPGLPPLPHSYLTC